MITPAIAQSVAEVAHNSPTTTEAKSPKVAAVVLEMLASGSTYNEIVDATQVPFNTIAAIKSRHPETLDIRRQQWAVDGSLVVEKMRALIHKKAEMLFDDEDQLKKVPLQSLVLSAKIAEDGVLTAAGEAKFVIESNASKPSLADAIAAINAAREAIKDVEIPTESIDV